MAFRSCVVRLRVAVCAWLLLRGLLDRKPTQPFLAALALFVLCFAGIGISFYPFIVPTSVTIWQAAGPDESLGFLLVGAAALVPRSEEHTSELQSLMRISYAVFCLKKKILMSTNICQSLLYIHPHFFILSKLHILL